MSVFIVYKNVYIGKNFFGNVYIFVYILDFRKKSAFYGLAEAKMIGCASSMLNNTT